mgnify:CR=1 FL=1
MQKANQTPVFSLLFAIYMAWNSVWLSLKFCVTLWHMSICTGVIIAGTFQQVDCTPLQYVNINISREYCHEYEGTNMCALYIRTNAD